MSEVNDANTQFQKLAAIVCDRLARNKAVRRNLPGNGRLRIERQLPFLCVHRSSPTVSDLGTRHLVTTEAAYLFSTDAVECHEGLAQLVQQVIELLEEHFDAFLMLEIWADQDARVPPGPIAEPAFRIIVPKAAPPTSTIVALEKALARIRVNGQSADVSVERCARLTAPGFQPLLLDDASAKRFTLGVAVRPIYRDNNSETLYPVILQTLRKQLAGAIREAVYTFMGTTSDSPQNAHQALGPTSIPKSSRLIDQQLCEVSEAFDLLLQVTPVNVEAAWDNFRARAFDQDPVLLYRPLPYHPSLLKRKLFAIQIEQIEDPTLAHLFWEKQEELDRQLTGLANLGTQHFRYASLQLYGSPDAELGALAQTILSRVSAGDTPSEGRVTVPEFVARLREEVDWYHQQMNEFNATVELSDHIASGMLVVRDRLYVSKNLPIHRNRVEPLLHHEIGTHLLTYFNGRSQPVRQLYAGLAGYEELQEGLAVLAEYLVGGLTASRLRSLAARVVAVRSMVDGASFVDVYRLLHGDHHFESHHAFIIALRVFRGGGFTKDMIYLRGLAELLKYLANGHDIEPLYVGKIGLHHLPYIQELRRRAILRAPTILPRFWQDPRVRAQLETCRGLSVPELLETSR